MEPCQAKDLGLRSYILLLQTLIWLWVTCSLKRLPGPEDLVITDSEDQRAINFCCVTLGNFLSLAQGTKMCISDLSFLRTKTYHKSKDSKWVFNSNGKRVLKILFLFLLTHMGLANLYLWKPDRHKILIPKINLRDFSLSLCQRGRATSGSSWEL